MSAEGLEQLAEPSSPEDQSFDSNKFERVLIFEKLNEIGSKIYTHERVTSEEVKEILNLMDDLAAIGYFFTPDVESYKTPDDLAARGINPRDQKVAEDDFIRQNMEYFQILLENIFAADEIPPGFIEEIKGKLRKQMVDDVRAPIWILMTIRQLENMYPRD